MQRGATALTESWQANHDASNNHMMLGHLMEWFYWELAGIQDVPGSINESGKPIGQQKEIQFVRKDAGYSVYKVGSGTYRFNARQ